MCQRIIKTHLFKVFLSAENKTLLILTSFFFFFNSSSLLYSQFNTYYRFQCFALKPNNRSLKTFIIKIMWKCGHYQSSSLETVLKKSCKVELLYSMSSLVLAFHFLYCEYELYAHIQ